MSDMDKKMSRETPKRITYKRFSFEPRKSAGGVAILKYGSSNNFHLFKSTLPEAALKEYVYLGMLIEQGKYYEPKFKAPVAIVGLSARQQEILETESLKKYQGHIEDMIKNRPKLYGLMMQHLSVESKDIIKGEKDYDIWHGERDP